MAKKDYNTKTVASVWTNTNKKTQEDFVSINMTEVLDKEGKPNKYYGGNLFFEDEESGKLYKVEKFKFFESDGHPNILGNICVELNDEEYSTLVTEED